MTSLKNELARLQDSFATVDLLTHRGDPAKMKLLVKVLLAMRIRMDGNKNQKRPHVHVDYGKRYHTASYTIDNGKRIAGELNGKYDREVRFWITRCRNQLLEAWELTQSGKNADEVICELRAA